MINNPLLGPFPGLPNRLPKTSKIAVRKKNERRFIKKIIWLGRGVPY